MSKQRYPRKYSLWIYYDPDFAHGDTIIKVMGYGESSPDHPWYINLYYYSLDCSSHNRSFCRRDIPEEIDTHKGFNLDRFWDLVDAGRLICLVEIPRGEGLTDTPLLEVGDPVGGKG